MKKILIIVSLAALTLFTTNNVVAQGCDTPSEEGVTVFGYIQPELNVNFGEETSAAFGFRRARIGVMGTIPYDFSYYVMLEMSPIMNPNETGPFLLDAFVTYSRFNFLKVSVGSF